MIVHSPEIDIQPASEKQFEGCEGNGFVFPVDSHVDGTVITVANVG